MATLTPTVARIAPVFPEEAEIYDFVAGSAIVPGDAVRIDTTTGKAILADGTGTAASKFRGVALGSAGAGQGVSVLKRGHVYGYDLGTVAYGDPIYVSNTAGDLDTAAGTVSRVAGMIVPLSNSGTPEKLLYIDADWGV